MLLTIDVGNTNISCGIFKDEELIAKFRFLTKQNRTTDELALQIHAILEVKGIKEKQIKDVIISSVVPNLNNDLIMAVDTLFGIEPIMIGAGTKIGLAVKTDDPKSVGADMIVDAVAAYEKYKRSCIIVDFGTATKFIHVSDHCEFLGCIISPGIEIFANTLHQMTAQLPSVQLKKPATIVGKNTVTCMQSGIFNGYIGLVEGLIKQMKEEIGEDLPVLATGGLGRVIYPETKSLDEYDPNLAYEGMMLIYKRNKKS